LAAGGAAGAALPSPILAAAEPGEPGKARLEVAAVAALVAVAESGPRESPAATPSQSRSGDSEPGSPRRSVRPGAGEDEDEEAGVGGAAERAM
jgi:hypothetical protein